MITSICDEIVIRREYLENKDIGTIYFGGGTPSLLSKDELKSIINTIYEHFNVDQDVEITLEANPDDISEIVLNDWKYAGINRLSIGIQSFKSSDLKWMNRAHTVTEGINSIDLAKLHGFNNITVDLIYGLPELSMKEWSSHIDMILSKGIPHVSAYCLTVEEKTLLKNWVDTDQIKVATDDEQSAQFIFLQEKLEQNGFEHYEISNFSKPGYRSRHNSSYWSGDWYLGVGPSAHSFRGDSRSWNVSNNHSYIRSIQGNEVNIETEQLTEKDLYNEKVLTGLRTSEGLNRNVLNQELLEESNFIEQCGQFIEKGWMTQENAVYILTAEGKLRADLIASELFLI